MIHFGKNLENSKKINFLLDLFDGSVVFLQNSPLELVLCCVVISVSRHFIYNIKDLYDDFFFFIFHLVRGTLRERGVKSTRPRKRIDFKRFMKSFSWT